MKTWESNCVQCETCIRCGRKEPELIVSCDYCGDTDAPYTYDGQDCCKECLLHIFCQIHEIEEVDFEDDLPEEHDADWAQFEVYYQDNQKYDY